MTPLYLQIGSYILATVGYRDDYSESFKTYVRILGKDDNSKVFALETLITDIGIDNDNRLDVTV